MGMDYLVVPRADISFSRFPVVCLQYGKDVATVHPVDSRMNLALYSAE